MAWEWEECRSLEGEGEIMLSVITAQMFLGPFRLMDRKQSSAVGVLFCLTKKVKRQKLQFCPNNLVHFWATPKLWNNSTMSVKFQPCQTCQWKLDQFIRWASSLSCYWGNRQSPQNYPDMHEMCWCKYPWKLNIFHCQVSWMELRS